MNEYLIKTDYTLLETIDQINNNKNRAAIVINNNSKVIGVVSQGDIIRALCYGKDLYSRIDSIVIPSFLYLNDRDMDEAYKLFKKNRITLLPIVDNSFCLIDIINLDDIYKYMEGKCNI